MMPMQQAMILSHFPLLRRLLHLRPKKVCPLILKDFVLLRCLILSKGAHTSRAAMTASDSPAGLPSSANFLEA